jgi:hypothetical protein
MDKKAVRVFASFEEMNAEEYRYWQSRPAWERMKAVPELSRAVMGSRTAMQMTRNYLGLSESLSAPKVKHP